MFGWLVGWLVGENFVELRGLGLRLFVYLFVCFGALLRFGDKCFICGALYPSKSGPIHKHIVKHIGPPSSPRFDGGKRRELPGD
jgi:hypothetical protein